MLINNLKVILIKSEYKKNGENFLDFDINFL